MCIGNEIEIVSVIIQELRGITEVDGEVFEHVKILELIKSSLKAAQKASKEIINLKKTKVFLKVSSTIHIELNRRLYFQVVRNILKNDLRE